MPNPPKDEAKSDDTLKPEPEHGDELLRRMLKTPPKPHKEATKRKDKDAAAEKS